MCINIVLNSIFYIRLKSFLCILLFLNFIIWSSFHNTHHLIENTDFLKVSKLGHVHSDGSAHNHKKTTSPTKKKHQQQSEFGCLLLSFNSSTEKFFSIFPNKYLSELFENKKRNKFYTKKFINKNLYLLSSIYKRGPPKSSRI